MTVEAELEERLAVIQTQNITDASKALASDVARLRHNAICRRSATPPVL